MKSIERILFFLLLIGMFVYHKCSPETVIEQVETTRYDTIPGDSIPYPVDHIVPGKDSIIHDTIPADVDTLAILADYFSRSFYSDTITDDTTFRLVLNDIISQNKIISREPYYTNFKPDVIKTITKYPDPENKYYIGAEILMYKKSNNLYITGTMCSKKDKIYTLGFDPINKGVNVGFAVNIKNLKK